MHLKEMRTYIYSIIHPHTAKSKDIFFHGGMSVPGRVLLKYHLISLIIQNHTTVIKRKLVAKR